MPGLCGYFSKDRSSDLKAEFEAKLNSTQDKFSIFHQEDGFGIGAIQKVSGPTWTSFHMDGTHLFGLHGHCFDPHSGTQLEAASLGKLWRDNDPNLLDRLEGAFHFIALDLETRELTILNDRIGILPFYWHKTDAVFSFGPRLRHLVRKEQGWSPDPGPVINFLSIGHYLGPSTQVKEAHFLTPATVLSVDTSALSVSSRRYWNLVYEPDEGLSSNEHCKRLGNAIAEATSLLCPQGDQKPGIFLSGGWDSRAVLGAMLKAGQPPRLVVTNGVSDEIQFSDTWLAKKMAGDLGLPYHFCRRVPDIGSELWLDGIHTGEITTTNNPENFGQHRLGPDTFSGIDYILKGDVTWGSGDRAPTRDLSIGKVVPYPLMNKVKAVLNDDIAHVADDLYEEQIDGVMSHCQNDEWTERRDYLWQMGGINRYILGLGISDEEHIQVRRPLLAGNVLNVYTMVPENLRVLKNLFLQSINMFYPKLFAYGRNHTSNIANYYAYMAPFVRQRTFEHLDSGHDLNGLLDIPKCRKVMESFNPSHSNTWIPGLKRQYYNRLHDRFGYHFHRTRFYSEKNVKKMETSDTMLAFHIYLLLEWFHGENS